MRITIGRWIEIGAAICAALTLASHAPAGTARDAEYVSFAGPAPTVAGVHSEDASSNRVVPISACQQITEPGSYALSRHIEAQTGSDCIKILAPRVVLDLNGFAIRGSGTGTGAGIHANTAAADEVMVRNGSISGFAIGVVLKSGTIQSLRISNVKHGLYVGDGAVIGNSVSAELTGIQVHNASIEANEVTSGENGITCGISCSATSNTITGVPASAGWGLGGAVDTALANVITGYRSGIARTL